MIVTRAAENTIWFASCNMCHEQHQNCRSMMVAPDGQIHAQAELRQEQLVVADINVDLATRGMYKFDVKEGGMDECAQMLFADTVARGEYETAVRGQTMHTALVNTNRDRVSSGLKIEDSVN